MKTTTTQGVCRGYIKSILAPPIAEPTGQLAPGLDLLELLHELRLHHLVPGFLLKFLSLLILGQGIRKNVKLKDLCLLILGPSIPKSVKSKDLALLILGPGIHKMVKLKELCLLILGPSIHKNVKLCLFYKSPGSCWKCH